MFRHNWNNKHLQQILSDTKSLNINAIKSCIEADEAHLLLEMIKDNQKAKIYCLISCFTYIPSIKCIELLVANGTPLNMTFENNPYQSTPMEYLHKNFESSCDKCNIKALNSIFQAIELGKLKQTNKDQPVENTLTSMNTSSRRSYTFKRVSNILLSPLKKSS